MSRIRDLSKDVYIDTAGINAVIKSRNIDIRFLSQEMGYAKTHINNEIASGKMKKPEYISLCKWLGLNPNDYLRDSETDSSGGNPQFAIRRDLEATRNKIEAMDSEIQNIKLNISVIMREQERHNKKVEEMLGYIHTIAADMLKLWEAGNDA